MTLILFLYLFRVALSITGKTKRIDDCHLQGRKSYGFNIREIFHKYSLPSSSSVQSALKGLLEKDFVTKEVPFYMVYDRFFFFVAEAYVIAEFIQTY